MLGVWPGGMRIALGIRRPCRMASAGMSDPKQKPHPQIQILQISNTPQISPQCPRAFRPADQKSAPLPSCDFQKTVASAKGAAKNLYGRIMMRICIKNVSFKLPHS